MRMAGTGPSFNTATFYTLLRKIISFLSEEYLFQNLFV